VISDVERSVVGDNTMSFLLFAGGLQDSVNASLDGLLMRATIKNFSQVDGWPGQARP
jgi:hypothetical protein